MAKTYHSNIFTNCYKLVGETHPNFFIYLLIGGRGIGKSFSLLRGALEDEKKIMYVRRTDTEIKNCCAEFDNPYKAINEVIGRNVYMKTTKDVALILEDKEEGDGAILHGYASALSTFGKFRGADFSDVDLIIFDEFIKTSDTDHMKNESFMLFNLIETINRNRELMGRESVKVVLCSNANTIDSDIIRVLGLADKIRQLKENGERVYTDEERGVYLELLENKNVKDLKSETKLYKLTKGTAFYDMALGNEFTRDYFGDVKKVDYRELLPVCSFNNIYFYKHKSKNLMYACNYKAKCDSFNDLTIKAFKRSYGFAIGNYMERGLILYQNYAIKLDVANIFNL